MRSLLIALSLSFVPVMAGAASLQCTANFDDSSRYLLAATVDGQNHISGDLIFRYQTDDGQDLQTQMKITEEKLIPGQSVFLRATDSYMTIQAVGSFVASKRAYSGSLHVAFSMDNAGTIDADMSCALN